MKSVIEAVSARQKLSQGGSLHTVNDRLKTIFNEAITTQIAFLLSRGLLFDTRQPKPPTQLLQHRLSIRTNMRQHHHRVKP